MSELTQETNNKDTAAIIELASANFYLYTLLPIQNREKLTSTLSTKEIKMHLKKVTKFLANLLAEYELESTEPVLTEQAKQSLLFAIANTEALRYMFFKHLVRQEALTTRLKLLGLKPNKLEKVQPVAITAETAPVEESVVKPVDTQKAQKPRRRAFTATFDTDEDKRVLQQVTEEYANRKRSKTTAATEPSNTEIQEEPEYAKTLTSKQIDQLRLKPEKSSRKHNKIKDLNQLKSEYMTLRTSGKQKIEACKLLAKTYNTSSSTVYKWVRHLA